MKILFVMYDNEGAQNPIPMGSCYIAGYLYKKGFTDIHYYSQDIYHYSEDHLTDYLDHNHFDVVCLGFTAGYFQYNKVVSICRAINKSKDRPFVILGGHGPTPTPEFFLEVTKADVAVMGEGEIPCFNLITALDSNTSFKAVKGIAYRDGDEIVVNERESVIKDLDSIPSPYYDLLPMEYYINAKLYQMKPMDRAMWMITSRGCNYKCNFCQRLEKGIRFRSIEAVIDELKRYIKDYHITFITFWDELFMFSEKRVTEFAEEILKENIKINYWCTGRLNIANKNILKMLKRSGCSYIDYGIEQFDDHSLVMMNKVLTEEQIVKGIELTQKEEIRIGFNIIFGNLGDTKESLRKSMDFLKKYNDYGQIRVIRPVTPYPGSQLYNVAIKEGLIDGPADFYEKHKNVELLTVNFTGFSESEFYQLLFDANKEVLDVYYDHLKKDAIDRFKRAYAGDINFRGARHV